MCQVHSVISDHGNCHTHHLRHALLSVFSLSYFDLRS